MNTKQKVYYLVLNILLFPLALILLIIKKITKIYFVRMIDNRIGHLCANTDLFLRTHPNTSKVIAIASSKPANAYVLNKFKQYLRIWQIPKWLYSNPFFITLSVHYSILHKWKLYYVLPFNSNEYKEFDCNPIIKLSDEEKKRGQELLKKMNVFSWYVCIHQRDSTYLKKHLGKDVSEYDFRDCSIENFKKAAQYIASKGGVVIRMGHQVDQPINDPNIIDYATHHRSEFGDYYLLATCKFFLGTTSGLCDLGTLFNTPYVCTNLIPLKYPPKRKGDVYIPKLLFSEEKNRLLTFKEILESDVINYTKSSQYKNAKLKPRENTQKEIEDLTKEYLERESNELQNKFEAIIPTSAHFHGCPAKIGANFLKDHQELLE